MGREVDGRWAFGEGSVWTRKWKPWDHIKCVQGIRMKTRRGCSICKEHTNASEGFWSTWGGGYLHFEAAGGVGISLLTELPQLFSDIPSSMLATLLW